MPSHFHLSFRALSLRLTPIATFALVLSQPAGSQDAKLAASQQQGTAPSQPVPQPPLSQGPPITSDTKMVTMLAAVRDKHGNFVRDLKKQDFTVTQDAHPQTITYFAQDPNIALTVGLLVDTSMSQRRVLDQERGASGEFLDKMFDAQDAAATVATKTASAATDSPSSTAKSGSPAAAPLPRDQAFIVRFDFEVELEQDITANREKLENALRRMDTPEFSRGSGSDPDDPNNQGGQNGQGGQQGNHRRGGHGAGTLLYDAIYLSSEDIMHKQQGRKALVLLTDGDDRGSKESLENAIEAAQRSDTLVYSILFRDPDGPGNGGYGGGYGGGRGGGMGGGGHHGGYPQQESRPDGKKVLERISRETGGRFFEVTKKQSIDDIYAAINDELRSQYSIGYKPEPADSGPGYHKIQLAADRKDLSVQTREGYYTN
jgi:VWFA-related protein